MAQRASFPWRGAVNGATMRFARGGGDLMLPGEQKLKSRKANRSVGLSLSAEGYFLALAVLCVTDVSECGNTRLALVIFSAEGDTSRALCNETRLLA